MANFGLILLCLAGGWILSRTGRFPEHSSRVLNAFVIHLSFPALVLLQVPAFLAEGGFGADSWVLVSMPWLMAILAVGLFAVLGPRLGWSRATIGAIVLTAGFSNTSFVGFPVLETLLGPEAIKKAIILDQAGCFLALSTIGVIAAAAFSGRGLSARGIAQGVLFFPPFLALVLAIAIHAFGVEISGAPRLVLERLSVTLVPLALVSVGTRLRVSPRVLKGRFPELAWGLGFKLVFAPLVFTLFYVGLFDAEGLATRVTLLESAMAPIITGAVIATEYELDSEIANLLVGVGIPVSLVTVPAFNWLLNYWQ